MKTLFTFSLAITFLALLTACGQKGPLIVTQEDEIQQQTVQQSATADKKWDTNEASLKKERDKDKK